MTNTTSYWLTGRYHIAGARRVVLAKVGPKWAQCCYLTDGDKLVLSRVPATETRYFTKVAGYESPRKLALRFRRGRLVGKMTKTARALTDEAKAITEENGQ